VRQELDIGIAADLRPQGAPSGPESSGPGDRFEEYDSPATVDAIAAALAARGHRPRFLGGGRRFLEAVLATPPDLVFNLAEGPAGAAGTRSREAHVPAVCEMLGIPFTGSDPLTLAATLDKAVAKRLVASAGVATPRFAVVDAPEALARLDLAFPRIAKPLREGSSIGIRRTSRADDAAALAREVRRLLADYPEPVLVEEFCTGPEFTVAILGEGDEARVLGVMEVVPLSGPTEQFVYSVEVKRNFRAEVEYHVPPKRPAALVRKVEEVARLAARALGCRDLCRVDVRVGSDGEPKFLEANPLPGLAPGTGDVVILAERAGIDYADLIERIVGCAAARHGIPIASKEVRCASA
jgi:D-alanine-D-alanine ligase